MNNSNLRPILHVSEMMDYWSNFRCLKGVPLFNAIVPAASPEFSIAKLCLQKLETSLYRVVQRIYRHLEPLIGVARECDRRTDIQTDRLWHNKSHTSLGCAAKKCGPRMGGCRLGEFYGGYAHAL